MRLILTHHHADFDAIASMLAMYKLDPTARPVLPVRVNRNVRNFLTLYADLLPVLYHEDLTRGGPRIERVYVVDTQTFDSVRGLKHDIPVHIFDHHELTRELPDHYTLTIELVGANTTHLVERIRERHISLQSLEASLLMLGIYEDTGSLTYGKTTVRDIQAAAWLLEKGARLELVRDFLTHPLYEDQWDVYEQFSESAFILRIAGHSILIATADAEKQDVPEIASIVPKVNDLYDPNASFFIVQMNQDIQLICRSGVEEIDVAIVGQHFGGGGHSRASAALVQQSTIKEVETKLHNLLPSVVQPSVRVADLMSRGQVQTIEATSTVEQAAQMMQRSGHEGYPVMQEGRLLGLLTRRAVDRAMNHNFQSQPISDIMNEGTTYVSPEDSLETLQRQMMRSGWGQMPVLNEQGQLIGIVTRTDLIRRWGERHNGIHSREIVLQQLKTVFPTNTWQLAKTLAEEAKANSMGLYLVGGLVRDLLLGVPNLDIDFVVEGDAVAFVKQLKTSYGGDIRYHHQFKTGKWLLNAEVAEQLSIPSALDDWPNFIDFASARTEFYEKPTVLPTVWQSSIKQDLHRRDFTINTMAIRLAPEPMGELLDFYNGKQDLQNRIIRVLHSLSFVDDPTRMIRAVRFEQRLGFEIEPRTMQLLRAAVPLVDRVTGDRLRTELNLILAESHALRDLRRLDELGILTRMGFMFGVDEWLEATYRALQFARKSPPWDLPDEFDDWRVAAMSLMIVRYTKVQLDQLIERLMISKTNARHLHMMREGYHTLQAFQPNSPPSSIVFALEKLDEVAWLALWAAAPYAYLRRFIEGFTRRWRYRQPNLSGTDLHHMGLKPGPAIGEILTELRRAWLDGDVQSEEEEQDYVRQLVEQKKSL